MLNDKLHSCCQDSNELHFQLLNEEQDSFSIENAGEWRGNRHMAAVAEGLHGLQYWPGNWESSGRGTLFPSQKRLL